MTESTARYPSHKARLTSQTRGYFVFLVDQSYSMSDMFGNESSGMTLAQATARMINAWIEEMCIEATKTDEMKDWFDLSVIGYGTDDDGEPIVGTAFTDGALAGKERVTVPELSENISFEETVEQKFFDPSTGELETESTERPAWIRPVVRGATPLMSALYEAHRLVEEWIEQGDHKQQSLPPIVINITDAELNDEGGEYTPEQYAQSLKDLQTDDGNVLLFNCQLSPNPSDAILCPDSIEQLPANEFAHMMYRMSSDLPEAFVDQAKSNMPDLRPGAKCLAYNTADTSVMIRFFKMGTLVASQLR
jgi:hypothetical protein